MRPGRIAPVALLALAAGCSSPKDAASPAVTLDERRALAEAEAMIPAGELPAATPAASESAEP